jgi:hypothetical protein
MAVFEFSNGVIQIGNVKWQLPKSRLSRIIIGILLILGGFLGFLPVLGFWMLPLGIFVLSHDLAPVRRFRRRLAVYWARRREEKQQKPR